MKKIAIFCDCCGKMIYQEEHSPENRVRYQKEQENILYFHDSTIDLCRKCFKKFTKDLRRTERKRKRIIEKGEIATRKFFERQKKIKGE